MLNPNGVFGHRIILDNHIGSCMRSYQILTIASLLTIYDLVFVAG
jgi:hypothetical protein